MFSDKMAFRKEAVTQLLREARLTQRELGDELRVPQSTISRWLHTGITPNMSHLDALYRSASNHGVNAEFYVKPIGDEETTQEPESELSSRIISLEKIKSQNVLIFVQGSWEIAENVRNVAASQKIAKEGLASTLLYESSRDWKALQNAGSQEEWISAFEDKNYGDELAELKALIDYVKREQNVKDVYLSGSSFGGGLATLASDSASRLLLACPQIYCPEEERVSIYQGFPDTEQFIETISQFQGRLRIIHGDNDERVPVNHSTALYERAGTQDKRFVLLPGSHTFTDNIDGYVQEHTAIFR